MADQHLGVAEMLSCVFPDRRDMQGGADMIRARIFAIARVATKGQ